MKCEFLISKGDLLYATIDLGVYPISAVLRVAYWYTEKCYVHLQFEGPDRTQVGVRFRSKAAGRDLSSVAGQFMNDLLDQALRENVAQDTEAVRNLILAHALSETNLLTPEQDLADPADDPLLIGMADDARR